MIVIVVSRYNENVEWTKQFSNVVIYNKGSNLEEGYNEICLENVGREGHTYYKYIYDNYDTLEDYTVFLQGNPFDHSPNLVNNLNKYIHDEILNIDFEFLSEWIIDCNLSGCVWDMSLPLRNVYKKLFNHRKEHMAFKFGAGAQFIVSKKQILNRPREFYLKLIELLQYSVSPMEGFVIERFHPLIFSDKIELLPVNTITTTTIVAAFVSNVNERYEEILDRYYQFGKVLLQSNTPKIIFVDEGMLNLIGNNYDAKNTVIIKINKSDMYLYNYVEHLTNFELNTNNNKKDTFEFIFTMCNKTEWIKQAILLNTFNTDNFMWIDFGIRYIFKCSDEEFIEKINELQFKKYENIRIGGIWNIDTMYTFNIYRDITWYFAGGVFGGHKDALLQFADVTKEKCIEIMTEKNTIMWETNIWYLIYKEEKIVFDIYHCNHDHSLVDNY